MKHQSSKSWFTASELAALALPGVPRSKRKVSDRAKEERWAFASDQDGQPLARLRRGRGGGLEYSLAVLPLAARSALVNRGIVAEYSKCEDEALASSQLWSWFESQSEKTKNEAQQRLDIIEQVGVFEQNGMTRSSAVAAASSVSDISASTIWAWLKLIQGIAAQDRLPCLAPQRRGGGAKAEIDPAIWQQLKSDYLRPEKPTFSSCYLRAKEVANARGIALPAQRTMQRRLEREVDPRLILARREGAEALRRSMPAQKRTVAHLHALEIVNIDGHKFDVFVKLDDGRTVRPMMVAIQDIYSRKFVAWRLGETESAVQTRLAFADLFRDFGIPKACVLDNGRAFASKWITGGAKTRFRFKVKDSDPTGLLTSLGIAIHWAMPYRGQSKPIERAFRDLCDTISKHPACAGAYTGNSPMAKPENYGDRAIPMEQFRALVAKGMAAHNAREGRRTETARGRSFDQAFAESYAAAPIGKATPEQLRLALLTAEQIGIDRRTGEIRFHGNRYWSPEMSRHHGRKVVVRFDPDNLHEPLHVYDPAGGYLGATELIEDSGFADIESAKRRAKQEAELRRRVREAEHLEDLLTADEIAARLPDYEDEGELPEPQVIRPVRHHGTTASARRKPQQETQEFGDRFARAVGNLRIVE